MKAGFLSKEDRIVLGELTETERCAMMARARQKAVSKAYAKLKAEMKGLGVNLNGSCVIYDDGRLRYQEHETDDGSVSQPETVSDDETDHERVLSRLRYYASAYSYASLGRLIGVSTGTVRAYVDGRYGPSASTFRSIAKVVSNIEANKPATLRALTPVGSNRGWNS